jgi:hypothetical protein
MSAVYYDPEKDVLGCVHWRGGEIVSLQIGFGDYSCPLVEYYCTRAVCRCEHPKADRLVRVGSL